MSAIARQSRPVSRLRSQQSLPVARRLGGKLSVAHRGPVAAHINGVHYRQSAADSEREAEKGADQRRPEGIHCDGVYRVAVGNGRRITDGVQTNPGRRDWTKRPANGTGASVGAGKPLKKKSGGDVVERIGRPAKGPRKGSGAVG